MSKLKKNYKELKNKPEDQRDAFEEEALEGFEMLDATRWEELEKIKASADRRFFSAIAPKEKKSVGKIWMIYWSVAALFILTLGFFFREYLFDSEKPAAMAMENSRMEGKTAVPDEVSSASGTRSLPLADDEGSSRFPKEEVNSSPAKSDEIQKDRKHVSSVTSPIPASPPSDKVPGSQELRPSLSDEGKDVALRSAVSADVKKTEEADRYEPAESAKNKEKESETRSKTAAPVKNSSPAYPAMVPESELQGDVSILTDQEKWIQTIREFMKSNQLSKIQAEIHVHDKEVSLTGLSFSPPEYSEEQLRKYLIKEIRRYLKTRKSSGKIIMNIRQ